MLSLELFKNWLDENNEDYIEKSIYQCDDGITFLYKSSDDELHSVAINLKNMHFVKIR